MKNSNRTEHKKRTYVKPVAVSYYTGTKHNVYFNNSVYEHEEQYVRQISKCLCVSM